MWYWLRHNKWWNFPCTGMWCVYLAWVPIEAQLGKIMPCFSYWPPCCKQLLETSQWTHTECRYMCNKEEGFQKLPEKMLLLLKCFCFLSSSFPDSFRIWILFPFVKEKCLPWAEKCRLSWALWSQTVLATLWLTNTWLWTTAAAFVHLLQAKSLCLMGPLRWRTCFGLSKIPTAIKKTFFCIRKQTLWGRSCCILKQQVVGQLWKTQLQELAGI